MKKMLLIIWVCLLLQELQAQLNLSYQTIDINNISASFGSDGMIAVRISDTTQHFEVPKGSGIQALFAGTLWIGGLDGGGNLHLAANRYYESGQDYFPGPIATTYDSVYDDKYNKVWKMHRNTIQHHIQHYADAGYSVPAAIADWPAHGNPANGEAFYLAPYVDANLNHYYDPEHGDYPFIKGDEALYIIYNDIRDLHTESNGMALGIEVHQMIYGYDSPSDTSVNNTLFINTRIINRSTTNYHDIVVGSWNDFDLGCFQNDRVGCDTTLNAFFCYNGYRFDNDCMGLMGYGDVMSSIGVTFLNSPLHNFAYFINGSIPSFNEPMLATHYMNYMTCSWWDGTPFTYGGTGLNQNGSPTCFLLPGNPCDSTDWSDQTSLLLHDRRAMGSTGKFNLPAGSTICFDMAYVYAEGDTNSACVASGVTALKQSIGEVKQFYQQNQLGCFTSYLNVPKQYSNSRVTCFPNPATSILTIDLRSITDTNVLCTITDMLGKEVYVGQMDSSVLAQMDVSRFAKGIYVVRIASSKAVYSQMVVIE